MSALAEAIKDGDRILAVIKGSSIGQDGHSQGITYPNRATQHKLITQTLSEAGLKGKQINYLEAHGTGTPTGVPVEMEQLAFVYGAIAKDKCYVGSVKANIGHLETAAGIAGVIKVLLMFQHQKIPPQIHVKKLNPRIHLENTRLEIPMQAQEWQPENEKRRGAISSFGFGGSAVLVQEHPVPAPILKTSSHYFQLHNKYRKLFAKFYLQEYMKLTNTTSGQIRDWLIPVSATRLFTKVSMEEKNWTEKFIREKMAL